MNSTATISDSALRPAWPANGPRRFMLVAGGILMLAGTAKILAALGHSQMLDVTDPLFGVPFRFVIAFVGIAELIIAWPCLFTDRKSLSLALVAWLMTTLAVYRIGLWTTGWHHPYAFLGALAEAINVSPFIADGIITTTSVFLLVASGGMLCSEYRAVQAAKLHKMYCPSCGGHIRFPVQNLGRQIPCPHCRTTIILREPQNLKMSCYFCKQHIEFPAYALGEKIKCPQCKKDITLKEPSLT